MNLMGNVIVGIPIGGQKGASIRPYVAGGVGLIRATADESDFVDKLSTNDFAYNVGGGVFGTVNDHFGLRADLRYFRTTSDTNRYRFWRGLGGVALRF